MPNVVTIGQSLKEELQKTDDVMIHFTISFDGLMINLEHLDQ